MDVDGCLVLLIIDINGGSAFKCKKNSLNRLLKI